MSQYWKELLILEPYLSASFSVFVFSPFVWYIVDLYGKHVYVVLNVHVHNDHEVYIIIIMIIEYPLSHDQF